MIYEKKCCDNDQFAIAIVLFFLCKADTAVVAINDVTLLAMSTKSHAIYSNRMGTQSRDIPNVHSLLFDMIYVFNADCLRCKCQSRMRFMLILDRPRFID